MSLSYQLLAVIAALCQVTGTYGNKSVAMRGGQYSSSDERVVEMEFSYEDASRQQLKCQKYYIKCAQKGGPLEQCILDRK